MCPRRSEMSVYEMCVFLAVLPLTALGVLVPFLAGSRKSLALISVQPNEDRRVQDERVGSGGQDDVRPAGPGRVDCPSVRYGAKPPVMASPTRQFDGAASSLCPVGRGSPPDADSASRVPLYTDQFAFDPHTEYARMRARFGSLVPVWLAPGVPATLVIGYWTALKILNDPEHLPADASTWQRDVAQGWPVVPMMQRRPNALRSGGIEHARYRAANVAALERVDLDALHDVVERSAVRLIDGFGGAGRADL